MLLLLFALFIGLASHAQDYSTGIGLRSGWGTGLTVKHFLGTNKAVEGILDSRWHGFSITGLYEIHDQAFNAKRLNWYYGVGAHIGFWNGQHYRDYNNNTDYTVIGIDGILGLEYNFEEIPFNIGIDWKPALNVVSNSAFTGDGGAISIRYIF